MMGSGLFFCLELKLRGKNCLHGSKIYVVLRVFSIKTLYCQISVIYHLS